MAKHRKTRQEKMIADQRHITYHLDSFPTQAIQTSENNSKKSGYKLDISSHHPVVASYAYVKSDLRKTATVTAAIIVAQIFLFIFLNRV